MKVQVTICLLAGLAAALIGCGTTNQQDRIEAHKRWNETRARVLVGVGEEQFTVGDLDNARNSANEALALTPDLLEARELLGRVAIEKGNYARADRHLAAAAELAPRSGKVIYLMAISQERRGRSAEALTLYRKARALDPNNPAFILASAETLVALGRPVEALELIESKFQSTDQVLGLYKTAGELAMLTGKTDKAIDHFGKARYLDPDDLGVQEQLAKAYFFADRPTDAVGLLKALSSQGPYARTAWLHNMLGQCQLALGRPREAKASFEVAIDIEPDRARHWVGLAKASLTGGDLPRAILSARRALSKSPGESEATMVLGYALMTRGEAKAANEVLAKAVKRHPDKAMLKCLLGWSYSALDKPDKAVECYRATLVLEPEHVLARQLLASASTD